MKDTKVLKAEYHSLVGWAVVQLVVGAVMSGVARGTRGGCGNCAGW